MKHVVPRRLWHKLRQRCAKIFRKRNGGVKQDTLTTTLDIREGSSAHIKPAS